MSVANLVDDAVLLYKNQRFEGAFLLLLSAVAASSRKQYPSKKLGDRACFEKFLEQRHCGIGRVAFRNELHSMPHIFYKCFRCSLVHEAGLPIDFEFIPGNQLSIQAGAQPGNVLKLSHGWFHWLKDAVTAAECNVSEFND